jgi:diaminopimelate epimerase
MQRIRFTKMVASGNDFVVVKEKVPGDPGRLARAICDTRFGIGADGMLLLEKSRKADIRMRVLNADGSEAEMCGNGARCIAYYLGRKHARIETLAGIIESQINGDKIKIKLTDPRRIKLDIPVKVGRRVLKVNAVDTGVPHAVIFVEGLDKIDIIFLGRIIRYFKTFAPKGTNVNFIEPLDGSSFKIRTYERGVEGETLACGTGSVASAIIFSLKTGCANKINVHTKSQEVLRVYFDRQDNKFSNVWLEGKAAITFRGEIFYRQGGG